MEIESTTITDPLTRGFHKIQRYNVSRLKVIMHYVIQHKPIFPEEMFGK